MMAAKLVVSLAALATIVQRSFCAQDNRNAAGSERHIRFAGCDWRVKRSSGFVGPGPNRFSDSPSNVSVDAAGRLHLGIVRDATGVWTCAEVISAKSFGYGNYRFSIGPVDAIEINAVLGLFTWSDNPVYHHREIDIEISRWGNPRKPNAQFVIQPYTIPRNLIRFELPETLRVSSHQFSWKEESVRFESNGAGQVIRTAALTGGIPRPGDENVRINFWLNNGTAPKDGRSLEVVVNRFEYAPPEAQWRK